MIVRGLAWSLLVLLIMAGLWIWGYTAIVHRRTQTDTRPLRYLQDNPANALAVDSAVMLLRSGDLALRTGTDVISVMLRGMNQRDKRYSHCGIVMVEHGYPFVYHSIGGEDAPDVKLTRDSAKAFFAPGPNERLGITRLDLTPSQIGRLQVIAQRYYKAGITFDLDFDLATDDKMYCAEFVYKAVREATADTNYFPASRVLARTYIGVDDLCDPRHAIRICDVAFSL